MISRLTGHRRLRLWVAALGLTLTLVAIPQAWVMTASRAGVPTGRDWPLLLGREVMAQTQGAAGGGAIQGTVLLQGQSNHAGVEVELDGGVQTASDSAGGYGFADVSDGTHVLGFSFPGYLSVGLVVTVFEGQTATVETVELLGGDVDGNSLIDLRDLAAIALKLGASDQGADVNRDGVVNVRDLVFGGRNFGKMARAPTSSMAHRLTQLIGVLQRGNPAAAEAAIDEGMEILYGGLRPVPTAGDAAEQTKRAHEAISRNELMFAQALHKFSVREGVAPQLAARAFDLKLLIEQTNEVAEAVGKVTSRCGDGAGLLTPPCDELQSLLDESTGQEISPGSIVFIVEPTLHPSYSVKLRSPFIAPWGHAWDEDVQATRPIALGECETVFKETRGLMVRLHLDRITVVTDPWVSVFNVPRGTRVPIWSIQWVPSEYVKTFNLCNRDGRIAVDVSERVNQDHALNFFWRYFGDAQSNVRLTSAE